MKRAHDTANAKGYPVYAEPDATYFIGTTKNASGAIETLEIKTNTYWLGADFIINDSSISTLRDPNTNQYLSETADIAGTIINVTPTAPAYNISPSNIFNLDENGNARLLVGETKLASGLGYPAMLTIYNSNSRQYIRYGYTTRTGKSQQEVILIDAEGNIDPSTPILFDFETVTSASVLRTDAAELVIDGGEDCYFTTLSSQVICHSTNASISRNISITRPNTTLKNIKHEIFNEPPTYDVNNTATGGHVYGGFYSISKTNHVTIESCTTQGRLRCKEGTYDIGLSYANDILFLNCDQNNFFVEGSEMPNTSKCWWVMGSNYCKNITYDSCILTRFDAHAGVYNATIKNSHINSIRLTGGGTFLLENSTIHAGGMGSGFIQLRQDFGSTWKGDIVVKDCVYNYAGSLSSTLYVMDLVWEHHEYGYQTTIPNLIIDNLRFTDRVASKLQNVYLYRITNSADKVYTHYLDDKVMVDGKLQSVVKTITDTYVNNEVMTKPTALLQDYFDVTIERVVTYTVEHSDKTKEEITETYVIEGFENINKYNTAETVRISNYDEKYNYIIATAGFEYLFDDTYVKFVAKPFDGDTPFIDFN